MKKLLILASCLIAAGCGTGKGPGGTAPSANSGSNVTISIGGESNTPVAEINGAPITEKELTEKIGSRLSRLQSQLFDLQMQGVNSIIDERILEQAAKKENVSVQALLKREVNDKVSEVDDAAAEKFYEQNKARFRGKSFNEVKDSVKRQLFARQSAVFRNNYLDRLKDEAKIQVFLSRPTIDVSADDDPWKGGKNAPVTIIEFTDYQCPFCARARPTINQVLETYGDQVKYVLRDFPLSFHPLAQKAAEGAQCAGEQDKYWEYSDLLWANTKALDVPDLKKYAKDVGIDQAKFDQCLDSGKFTAEVQKDTADGSKAGVSGTPSFFINGQMLTGARPFEQFKEVIDLEIRTSKNKS